MLCKTYQNTGFLRPLFYLVRTKQKILSSYWKIWVKENPYSGIFYAMKANPASNHMFIPNNKNTRLILNSFKLDGKLKLILLDMLIVNL